MNNSRSLRILVTVGEDQPKLLQGLDVWLRLGLISELQVNKIARDYLICPLPTPTNVTVSQSAPVATSEFASPQPPEPVRETLLPRVPGVPLITRLGQSFKDELSVRWLLFLGAFLIVICSGVLAATQWSRFTPAGQYRVLFAYTSVFWGIGFWVKRKDNLKLTSQTLITVALFLVPLNFWAMDSFSLWQTTSGLITIAIATIALGYIIWQHNFATKMQGFAFLSLSLLHWGWEVPQLALGAVYLATIGTAIIFPLGRYQTTSLLLYGLGVILTRAIFIEQLPPETLGLAVGICGWLLAMEGLRTTISQRRIWQIAGVIILFFSWSITIEQSVYWQALLVNGLGLWFFIHRLQLYWQPKDLGMIFLTGLPCLLTLWELVPPPWQGNIVNPLLELTASQASPGVLLSVSLFPYLIFFTGLSDWLYSQDKLKVAKFGDLLCLFLAIALTLISCLNPHLRSLNLILSTITLGIITQRRQTLKNYLVYLTHFIGLFAFISIIDSFFPNLSQQVWALVLLLMMMAEWILSVFQIPLWSQSAWYLGFSLASISYVVLGANLPLGINYIWQLSWLLTAFTLTLISNFHEPSRQRQATWLSILGLIALQFLTVWQPEGRIMALSFATGLMYLNVRNLSYFIPATIHLGFALTFIASLLWQFTLSPPNWLLSSVIATIIFWLGQGYLKRCQGTLAAIYAKAGDNWGIFLVSLNLFLLTIHSSTIYGPIFTSRWQYVAVAALMVLAIIYRYWQRPKDIHVYSLIWAVEILIAEITILNHGSPLHLATANIILALLILVTTTWLQKLSPHPPISLSPYCLSSLESITASPLIFALIGICLRLNYFTPYTGFLTLGAALTGIGVASRRQDWKYITYFSLAGISLAWYELVIYQLSQASGGSAADGYIILAIVAVIIAFFYRLLAWWRGNKSEIFNLETDEIQITADVHYFIGTFLILAAANYSIISLPNLKLAALGVSLSLVVYSLERGRISTRIASSWVYVSLMELGATALYARLLWPQLSILDSWVVFIAGIIATLIYESPWRRWGWPVQPWFHSAIALPLLTIILTITKVSSGSLIFAAGFYGWIAKRRQNIHWTYPSLLIIDFAIARWLFNNELDDPLWYAALIGLSVLYIAQFNPKRQQRHHLRLIATSLIAVVAVIFHQETGLLPGILGLTAIFLGLGLRIRAFLLVGTATFLITVSYQLIISAFTYSFLKWIFGIIVGTILIAVAANFEQRREQISSVWQNWSTQLEEWE